MMIFHRYSFVPEAAQYQRRLICAITDSSRRITLREINGMRTHYEQFLDLLVSRRLLSHDDRLVYGEMYPVVKPCYINYDIKTDVVVRDYIMSIMQQEVFGLEA